MMVETNSRPNHPRGVHRQVIDGVSIALDHFWTSLADKTVKENSESTSAQLKQAW